MASITISAPAATVNTTTSTNATAMSTAGADTITSSIANLTGSTIDADAGTDQLNIIGGGSLTFGAATITNIEQINLIDDAVYSLTFNDANVAAAQSLKIVATAVGASNGIIINASAETNGTVQISAGAGNDSVLGGTGADSILGDSGNDSIFGGSGADTLSGGAGNDVLRGQAGNDTIDGGAGTGDQVSYTGATAAANINLLTGTATDGDGGTDAISNVENALGSNNNDTLIGSLGDNVLIGAGGADLMSGGDGNDILSGGPGADTLSGGTGLDRVDYAGAAAAVNVDLNGGTASDGDGGTDTLVDIERAAGSANNDTLIGDASGNLLRGNAGNDTLSGAGGNDMADYLNSTAAVNVNLATATATDGFGGTDTFVSIEQAQGSAFNDSLTGSAADNFFTGLAGNDSINGNNGGNQNFFDVVDYLQATSAVTVNLGTGTASDGQSGTDTLVDVNAVRGSSFGDALTGGSTLFVAGTSIETFDGQAGNDTLNGGDGNDRADYFNDPAAVTVNLGTGTASDGYGGTDTLLNIEMARGSTLADLLIGSNGAQLEFFDGRGGNDTISGGAGNDLAMYQSAGSAVNVNLTTGTATDGEGGTDVLNNIERVRGSDFNDTLIGSGVAWESFEGMAGNDTISGGAGVDRYDVLNFTTAAASINLTTGTATDGLGGTDQLDSIENVRATNFNDTVTGNAGANGVSAGSGNDVVSGLVGDDTLMGDNGNDTLDGGADNDQLFGDAGDDTVIGGLGSDALVGDGTGETGNDQLSGDAGEDTLFGGDGNDLLLGGIGFDHLVGGAGNDTLSGGVGGDIYFGEAGADRFVIATLEGDDMIADFESGTDKIDLTAFAFGTFDNFRSTLIFDLTNDNGYTVKFASGNVLSVIGTVSVVAGDYLI